MGQQDIIDIIISDIRRLGVDFRAVDELDALAVISPSLDRGLYDKNRATPFILAHEMFHKMNNHGKRKYDNDIRNTQEHDANVAATAYLWSLYIQMGGTTEYVQHFIDVSGTPDYLIERLLKVAN